MKTALKKVALGVMLAVPGLSMALGLGEIEVHTKLNEPLRAEIKLLYGDASEAESTEVQLATDADFARVGMSRDVLPNSLSFEIARNDDGEFVIVVTTTDPVVDPFVDFLIDVNWSNGRLLREYVVLLDPPVSAPSAGPAQVTPLADDDFYQPPAEATTPDTSTSDYSTPATSDYSSTDYGSQQSTYGPVASGDTLWVIARDWRPSQDVTINQMMVMLLQMNPDAFFQDNINALKKGAILRMPSMSDFDSLDTSSATASVRSQNQLWDDYRLSAASRTPTVSDDTSGAEYDYADSSQDSSYDDSRLEIVPSAGDSSSDYDSAGGGDPALEAELADVRLELQRTREDLVSAGQENAELSSRVTDLENLISNLERAVALKDADLADLQDALDRARDQAYDDDSSYAAADPGLTDTADDPFQDSADDSDSFGDSGFDDSTTDDGTGFADNDSSFDDTADSTADLTQTDDTPVDTSTSVTPPAVDVVSTQPAASEESGGIMGMLTNPLVLGGVGALVLGGGGFAFWRRRKAAEAAGASLIDAFADDAGDEDLAATAMMQTSEMRLVQSVEKAPDDPQSHLALLRSYYATADRAAFVKAARAMRESIGGEDHPSWTEVRTMGANLAPDDEMFAAQPAEEEEPAAEEAPAKQDPPSLAIRSVTSDDLEESDDITDLDLDFSDQEESTGESDEADDDGDMSLDFDLDDDDGDAESPAEAASDDDDMSLDFDLDDLEPDAGDSTDDTDDDDSMDLDFDLDDDDSGSSDEPAEESTADSDDGLDFDLDDIDLDAENDDEPAGGAHTEFEIEAITPAETEDGADADASDDVPLDDLDDLDLTLEDIDDPASEDGDGGSDE
jgi:pilus assembly protein FimV